MDIYFYVFTDQEWYPEAYISNCTKLILGIGTAEFHFFKVFVMSLYDIFITRERKNISMWEKKINTRLSITTSSYGTNCLFRALLNTEVNIRHIHLISLLRKQLMVFLQTSLTMIRHTLVF